MRNFEVSQGVAHMTYFLVRNLKKKFNIEISALSHMEIYVNLQISENFLLDF